MAISLGTLFIQNIPIEKFFTGFFDNIEEHDMGNGHYIVGAVGGANVLFTSDTYKESKGINGMIECGDMLPNGLLSGDVPFEIPTEGID